MYHINKYAPPGPGVPHLRDISGTLPVPRPRASRGAPETAQDGPRRPQEAPRTQTNGPRRSQAAQDSLPTALQAPRSPPRGSERARRGVPRESEEGQIVDVHLFFRGFWLSRVFERPTLQDDRRAPKTAPRRPKRPPGCGFTDTVGKLGVGINVAWAFPKVRGSDFFSSPWGATYTRPPRTRY